MDKVLQQDWNLTPVDPDPDFNPEHNKRVIDEVIRKNELLAARKKREAQDGARERTSAIARYMKSLADGKTTSKVDRYFGQQELARLRGREILNRLKDSEVGAELKLKLKQSYKKAKLSKQYD